MFAGKQIKFGWVCLLGLLALALPLAVKAQGSAPQVLVLTADGPLTPAMSQYLSRGIRIAERDGAEALIFQLNTPGGSIELMTEMVTNIRASKVPVVVYVSPRGAMAGSAGTIITLSGHAAAMAPETAIGAASPVDSNGQDLGQTMQAKTKNILEATVRTLAERRGEKAVTLAQNTIESAQAVSAQEALDAGLIDFISVDVNELVRQLNGFQVQINGNVETLQTANAAVIPINQSILEQLLSILTNPTIVSILLIIGVQAILIELSSPGGWVAGFIGVVCLALSAYGLGVLTVNWFGIVFLVMAFALFILDIKAPTHGALTLAGVISLIVGALVLFNTPSIPSFQPRVPVAVIVGLSSITGIAFFTIMLYAVQAQKRPVLTGQERMIGRIGTAQADLSPSNNGIVRVSGEQWTATLAPGEEPLPRGAPVEVVKVEGVKLLVRKAKQ